MITSRKILFFYAIVVSAVLIAPNFVFAADNKCEDKTFQLIPCCALGTYDSQRNIYVQDKAPPLSCVETMVTNIAQIILALSGAIALLMFIYGGFLWMTAAGSASKVQQGTKIMIGTVIGLVIIFGANLAVTAVRNVLLGQGLGTSQSQSGTPGTSTTPENGCCVSLDAQQNPTSCADMPRGSCGTGSDRLFDSNPCAQIYYCQQLKGGGTNP